MSAPALWIVERSGPTVYLFGETVGLRREDVWLTEPIRQAFDDAAEFWCEVADAQEVAQSPLLARYGLSAEPLSSRLSARTRSRLQHGARALDVDPANLEGMRPWLAAQLLEQVHRSRVGIDADVSVHEVLVTMARAAGKSIRTELPDVDTTLSFFGGMIDETEDEYLSWTLDRVGGDIDETARQVAAWLVGDASVVRGQLAQLQATYPSLYTRLIVDRNRAWIARIDEMLDRATAFVLVGDAHMATEHGIPHLLADQGFHIRRVT